MKKPLIALLLPLALAHCGRKDGSGVPASNLATISINQDKLTESMTLKLAVQSLESQSQQTFNLRKGQNLDDTFAPGPYRIELDLVENNVISYSSNLCSEKVQDQSELHTLRPGTNAISVKVCRADGSSIDVGEPDDASIDLDIEFDDEPKEKPDQEITSSFFVDPFSQALTAYESVKSSSDERKKEALKFIAEQGTFVWLSSNWIPGPKGIQDKVTEYRKLSQGKMLGFIIYDVPGRDCGQYSSGGVTGLDEYLGVIQQVIDGLAGSQAMLILEPDALALSAETRCKSGLENATAAIASAVALLKEHRNIKTYLDASHGNWLAVETVVPLLKKANIAEADGFALNISNYVSTEKNYTFGKAIAAQLDNKPFLIDTSRNGRGVYGDGSGESWCNPPERALGKSPRFDTGLDGVEAFIWGKKPGESDGTCRGGLKNGEFMIDTAVTQYFNAKDDGIL
ncbi:glycoside hydrolase family 6 protein [Pseudobacteriovorax antillogorgiicola]|uniref:Glucanase n=1 Tax=Pseudobacteriovorax antillogorgiicola TaxID=1513793 RepID=A0A1Y6BSJ5_9BACT|nr:glycoside hydrolase family 6 protein [Pseudobacteriovorax antillogorgiicola]TCS54522.1 endoglucanase [Pseudobacteriovorax antillogorgiicola]SMF18830.1 endoglucanase [Pseudobacteriovorax antillogorgiicola]